jgi:Xaa-Pro aminopeptidase
MDYQRRISIIREEMERRSISLLFLTMGANLFYATGIRRRQPHPTDDNAYGDWASGAFLGLRGGWLLTVPRMGSDFFLEEAAGKQWIEDVRIIKEGEDPHLLLTETAQHLTFLRTKRMAVDDRAWTRTLAALQSSLPNAEITMAGEILGPMRMIKDEEELARMRHAALVTDEVYAETIKRILPGVSEYDLVHEIDYQFALRGTEYPSFVTAVRFNRPGLIREQRLRATMRRLESGDSVVFDFGCVYDGYCSDFGRTAFFGVPSEEFIRMHDTVVAAQQEAIRAMRPGEITAEDVNRIARSVLEEGGYIQYFTHRLGHGIGVTVHEIPYMDFHDRTLLATNMTLTVEPSSNVPRGLACRVEDVVVVTPSGGESLTRYERLLTVIET